MTSAVTSAEPSAESRASAPATAGASTISGTLKALTITSTGKAREPPSRGAACCSAGSGFRSTVMRCGGEAVDVEPPAEQRHAAPDRRNAFHLEPRPLAVGDRELLDRRVGGEGALQAGDRDPPVGRRDHVLEHAHEARFLRAVLRNRRARRERDDAEDGGEESVRCAASSSERLSQTDIERHRRIAVLRIERHGEIEADRPERGIVAQAHAHADPHVLGEIRDGSS